METKRKREFYRRNLPHIQPVGAAFFVTFRLQDSIPGAMLSSLKEEYEQAIAAIRRDGKPLVNKRIYEERKRHFARYDALLDKALSGPTYLKQPEIAQILTEQIHRFDGDLYDLHTYCIMSNHAHMLFDTSLQLPEEGVDLSSWESLDYEPLEYIMKRVKGPSGRFSNRLLGRKGRFWQQESYDHYVRNERELDRIVAYILENPVKAGLVKEWTEYPFTYLAPAWKEI
jgi:putative transposase